MENFSLIPFDEGTDILAPEPIREPVRPPSLPVEPEPVLVATPVSIPEFAPVTEPHDRLNNVLSKVLAPFVVLLTAIVVYRLFF